ncbi:VanZ family protein [Flavobacterium sp.]
MIIKTLLAHKQLWRAVAVFWTSIIFFLCLISSEDLPSINIKIEGSDKGVHFTFHFIFTVLWMLYIYASFQKITLNQTLKVILSSFLFGIVIEILQGFFTTTRSADVLDVVANTLGALSAGILLYFILNRINKLKT